MKSLKSYLILFLFTPITLIFADIINVPADTSTIQGGISLANEGDTVLVSEDLYYENINFKGKAITVASYFIMDEDTNHINNTIINGSQPGNPDSGSVVSFVSGEDTTSKICGFTITGGTGTIYDAMHRVGGGIYCKNSGARIVHNKIVNNSVSHNQESLGGGIGVYPRQSLKYVIIENNLIDSNSLSAQITTLGGGIFIDQGRIEKNMISNNISSGGTTFFGFGGGIACSCDTTISRSFVKIIANTISNNLATSSSTSHGGIGGGIAVDFCTAYIVENQINHNSIGGSQPGEGAGVRLLSTEESIVQGNRFEQNMNAIYGGGIFVQGSPGTIIHGNEIVNNVADSSGGGIHIQESNNSELSSNFFKKNSSKYGGGILTAIGNYSITNNIIAENNAFWGGGFFLAQVSEVSPDHLIRFINNTITGNEAETAGGIAITYDTKVTLLNTICWGNMASQGPEIDMATEVWSANLNVTYSDIRFGQDSIPVAPGATLNWLAGNIDVDPLFIPGDSLYHLMCTTDL